MRIGKGGMVPGRRLIGRRSILGTLTAAPFINGAAAWGRTGVPSVGYVSGGEKGGNLDVLFRTSIQAGLAEQGFAAPDKLRWLERYAGQIPDPPSRSLALRSLTQELVADGANVIIANGGSTRDAIAAAGATPVVYGFSADPVAARLADGLTRPLGNATGVTFMMVETNAKRIELLKEFLPSIARLALVSSPHHPGEPAEIEVCRRTVAGLGIQMLYFPVFTNQDLEKALLQCQSESIDALVAPPDNISIANRDRIAAWAIERRIPYASGWGVHADAGALMSYGSSVGWGYKRVGYYAARVLSGAKPQNMPIEQPSVFEFVINLKTAHAIGVAVPPTLLAQADRLID